MLTLVWSGAAVGILTKLYRVDLHVLSGIMYIGLGWVAIFVLPALARALSDAWSSRWSSREACSTTLGALVAGDAPPGPVARDVRLPRGLARFNIVAAACLYAAIFLLYLSA